MGLFTKDRNLGNRNTEISDHLKERISNVYDSFLALGKQEIWSKLVKEIAEFLANHVMSVENNLTQEEVDWICKLDIDNNELKISREDLIETYYVSRRRGTWYGFPVNLIVFARNDTIQAKTRTVQLTYVLLFEVVECFLQFISKENRVAFLGGARQNLLLLAFILYGAEYPSMFEIEKLFAAKWGF